MGYGFSRVDIGGLENPVANALLQVMYECGGKELSDRPELDDPKQLVDVSVRSIVDCTEEIYRPGSEFGARFKALTAKAVKKAGLSATATAQATRAIEQARRIFNILTVAELAFYYSDQLADSLVGPLSWSIRGRGRPQTLGDWTATCSSYKEDSNRLYRNVALQDEFADSGKEPWELPDFVDAAETAVEPLARCSIAYQNGLGRDPADQIVTLQQASRLLNVSPTTIGEWRETSRAGHLRGRPHRSVRPPRRRDARSHSVPMSVFTEKCGPMR